MRVDKIIRKALLLSGYDINSLNFDKDALYETATELLDNLKIDLQKHIGLSSTIKMAILYPVVDTKNHMYNDFLTLHPEAKVYKLPSDFVEYVGSTSNKISASILGDSILVYDQNPYSIFSEVGDQFEMEYRAILSLEQLPNYMETYAAIMLGQHLIMIKRPDDQTRMSFLQGLEAKEIEFLANNNNLRRQLNVHSNSYKGWR